VPVPDGEQYAYDASPGRPVHQKRCPNAGRRKDAPRSGPNRNVLTPTRLLHVQCSPDTDDPESNFGVGYRT